MPDDRRKDWEHGVDENLASLNTGQRVTDKQLDDLDLKYDAIDKLLRGDTELGTDGLIARLHHLETAILEWKAERVKLMVADVTVKGYKWEFLTKVTVQILILAGLLILGWDKVATMVKTIVNQKPAPLEKAIEDARHPKPRHRHYVLRERSESFEDKIPKQE